MMHVQLEIFYAYIEPHCKLKYWANGLISAFIDTSNKCTGSVFNTMWDNTVRGKVWSQ